MPKLLRVFFRTMKSRRSDRMARRFHPRVEALEERAVPAGYTWQGSQSADWMTAANWMPNGVPGVGDNVTFDTVNGNDPVLQNNVTIDSLSATAGFAGHVFKIGGNGLLTVTDGSPNGWNGGTLQISTTLNWAGTLDWTAGIINGGGTFRVAGTLILGAAKSGTLP